MNLENYTKEQKTIDLMKANLVGIKYFVFFAVVFTVPYYLIWGNNFSENFYKGANPFLKMFFPLIAFLLELSFMNLFTEFFLRNMPQKD